MTVDNVWTLTEENMLVAAFHGHLPMDEVAVALHKTPGSIRWKLGQLGLGRTSCHPTGPSGAQQPAYDDEHPRRRFGDRLFKEAMLAAIKAGLERPFVGVIRSRSTRYIRRIHPAAEWRYRSPAAAIAELGASGGSDW